MNGAQYRVKAEHPRRPGQPLRLTDKAGTFLAQSGDTCEHLTNAQLESFIRNGYVDVIEAPKKATGKKAAAAAEGEG